MTKKNDIDPKVGKVLKECGLGPEAAWKHAQSGKWIVLHWALEVVAAFKGIKYDAPDFLVAEPRAAVVVVTGHLGERSEWSVGEAVIDLNYKVTGKQQGYPFAMAEKRAKDRVILKLVGLHGYAYSEAESDDFEAPKPAASGEKQPEPQKDDPEQVKLFNKIGNAMAESKDQQDLQNIWMDFEEHRKSLPERAQTELNAYRKTRHDEFDDPFPGDT